MSKKITTLIDPVEIKFDMNQLIRAGLTVEEFLICYLLSENALRQLRIAEQSFGKIDDSVFKRLVEKGYCYIKDPYESKDFRTRIGVSKKFSDIIERKTTSVDDWIADWIDLWPRGVKSGNYYVRGDKSSVRHKMKSFMKKYPECSKDQIFAATKQYLQRMATDNYQYCKISDYFIFKDGASILASECENLEYEHELAGSPAAIKFGEDEL
jgi:hypothetical protein